MPHHVPYELSRRWKFDPCVFHRCRQQDRVKKIPTVHAGKSLSCVTEKCKRLHVVLLKVSLVNNLGPVTWYNGCDFGRSKDDRNAIKIVKTALLIDKFILIVSMFSLHRLPGQPRSNANLRPPKRDEESGGDWSFLQVVICLMR